jgi:hypothetical protein
MEKQADLPTMEGHDRIQELDDLGELYAEKRDWRQQLLQDEVELKEKLLAMMKKHQKVTYIRNNIEIRIKAEQETVKVKVKKPKKPDSEE